MLRLAIDPLPMLFHPLELGDETLLRFKLTTWKKPEMSLSIAWCHILGSCAITQLPAHLIDGTPGDASTLMQFMHALSNNYRCLRPVMRPTFEKYIDPV